jgi:hypothetical protein
LFLQQAGPAESRQQDHFSHYRSSALDKATHVFVRVDGVKPSLAPAYTGPYKVIDKHSNYYTIDRNGKSDTVSVSRLKAAHSYEEITECPPQPIIIHRSPDKVRIKTKKITIVTQKQSTPSKTRVFTQTRSGRMVKPNAKYNSVS